MIHRIIYLYLIFIMSVVNLTFGQQGHISEEIQMENDGFTLPGTLTYNSNLETQPLVIYVHGSGGVDRNGNQPAAGVNPNYIKQLNDSLTLKDIAFYRYDKRTSSQANIMKFISKMYFEAFVEDLNMAIDTFKDDKRFSSITLIGHSQGSLVSMLANHNDIDKFISLAGPGRTIDKSLTMQITEQNGDSLGAILTSHFKELSNNGSVEKVDPRLMAFFNKPTQPFIKSWMRYNPLEEIKKLKMPILILNGDKDVQVTLEDAKALYAANPKSKMVIIENMTHTLKIIDKDSDNYSTVLKPNFPLSQKLISTIEAFVKE
nr:alpha/beta hydrolase [uncultured Psychroserpens sp.]